MKKHLLFVLSALFGIAAYAQTEPAITLTVETDGNERNLTFAMTEAGHKLQIDWGNGTLVETEEIAVADEYSTTTTVTGTPVGEGIIKIYGEAISVFGCDSRVDGAQVTAINTSGATDLKELNVYTNKLTTLDLSQNLNLEKLNCYNNSFEELDLTANTKLLRLDAKNTPLKSINLSACTELTYLSLNDCPIEAIDLTANTKLASLYLLNCKLNQIDLTKNTALTYVNVNNNLLTALDVTAAENLGTLFCMGNQLTELKADNVTKSVNCSKNNFTLATLPVLTCKTYTYAPQNAMPITKRVWTGETIDLSAQDNITGLTAEAQKTAYTWKTAEATLEEGTDYTVENGVFTFLNAIDQPVYCEMTTAAFPKFSGSNTFKTAEVTVESEPGLYLSLTAEVDNNERNLTFASATEGNRILVDWGDGNLVKSETIALADEYGTTTTLTGTPCGNGEIKIYAREISVFGCDSRVDGAQITAINTSAATDLKELNVYTNKLTTLDLSQNLNLEKLNCYNNSFEELDLTANTKLLRLDAKNTPLKSINLSACTELTYLSLNDCPIEAIDLSGNTKLASLYLLNCKLNQIDLTQNTALTYVNVNNNLLTALDVTAAENLGTLFCMGNQLTELKADNVTKSVNCSKNNFTLATLPVLTCKTYTYAPQNAMQIAESVKPNETVDLSAQNNITGLAEEPQTTTYVWKTEDGTELVAQTDYTEENGIFTFLKKQDSPVYCEMTTAAFPKFSGSNVFKTTTTVVEGGTGIENTAINAPVISATRGNIRITGLASPCEVKVYSLSGQLIATQNATGSSFNLNVEPGMYVVTIGNHNVKVKAL
ncbi:MAG: T9SS type A sorting domain-containing protein [Paraprevotella sp.]|nr:T9SS type A sorting domain-containing protein [Paraprevotella sp.]